MKDGVIIPRCYTVDPFIKNIEIPSTISIFEVADFSIYSFLTLFCHETGSSNSKFNINRCNVTQFSRRFRFLRSRWWASGLKADLYRKYWIYKISIFQKSIFWWKIDIMGWNMDSRTSPEPLGPSQTPKMQRNPNKNKKTPIFFVLRAVLLN